MYYVYNVVLFFICYWHSRLVSQITCEKFCTSKTLVRLFNIQRGKSMLQLNIITSGACVGAAVLVLIEAPTVLTHALGMKYSMLCSLSDFVSVLNEYIAVS